MVEVGKAEKLPYNVIDFLKNISQTCKDQGGVGWSFVRGFQEQRVDRCCHLGAQGISQQPRPRPRQGWLPSGHCATQGVRWT